MHVEQLNSKKKEYLGRFKVSSVFDAAVEAIILEKNLIL